MALKKLFASFVIANMACSPVTPALPSIPATNEQSCREPIPSDYPSERVRIRNHTDFARQHYPERIAAFKREPLNCGDIVMLGDSLTERFEWQDSIAAPGSVRNRGIAGDTSDGVLERLGELTAARPSAVFILIGTNDLWTSNSPRSVARNVEQIIATLRTENPDLPIYLQTVFPVRSEPALNRKVREINVRLAELALASDVQIVDTYSQLQDEEGLLAEQYTIDGVHLSPTGYARWVSLINRLLSDERE